MPAKGRKPSPKGFRSLVQWLVTNVVAGAKSARKAAMTLEEYDAFCAELPHTTYVVQWGNAHVWKIGGKVFAIGGWQDAGEQLYVTFKTSELSYDMLKDKPGCRPAPYLASRGMKWIQRTSPETLDMDGLKDYVTESYRLVGQGLTKRKQRELGLLCTETPTGKRAV